MRRSATMVVCGALTLAACTGSGYEPGAEPSADTGVATPTVTPRVSGVLFVQRTQGGVSEDVQVGARFLRVAGVTEDALPDLVGTPAMPQTGSCVERAVPMATDASTRAEVRLLDVGAVDVRTGDHTVRMYPRRFPDLWNVVSGVLYGVEDTSLPQGRWRFTAQGEPSSGVGVFDVEAQSPDELLGVRLGDIALPTPPNTAAVVSRHAGVTVRWNRGYTEDRVAVVFEGAGTLVCGARDEGWLDVDAATMDRVAEILHGGGTVSVHRLRARPFTAPGLDAGTLVFDLAVRSQLRAE